jgi:hypothetical protein
MKLYHGTNSVSAMNALQNGILPRNLSKKSNWDHSVQSNKDCVYLTTAYAPYFAIQAANSIEGSFPAIIEIDTDLLDIDYLVPDEDALEQATRKTDDLPKLWSMNRRTRHYRKHLMKFAEHWEWSLKAIGNCAYMGVVPASAITRVVVINHIKQSILMHMSLDPSISIMNFRFCGDKYVQLLNWIFNNEYQDTDSDKMYGKLGHPTTGAILQQHGRDGIEMIYNR